MLEPFDNNNEVNMTKFNLFKCLHSINYPEIIGNTMTKEKKFLCEWVKQLECVAASFMNENAKAVFTRLARSFIKSYPATLASCITHLHSLSLALTHSLVPNRTCAHSRLFTHKYREIIVWQFVIYLSTFTSQSVVKLSLLVGLEYYFTILYGVKMIICPVCYTLRFY